MNLVVSEEINKAFDEIIDRRNTNCAKWDEMDQIYGQDLIHLGVADMDFVSASPIIEALDRVTRHGVFGYTILSDGFYTSLQNWYKKRFDCKIQRDWILFCPRIVISAVMAISALTQKGDKVIINTPAYAPLMRAITDTGRIPVINPLKYENGFYSMDMNALEEMVDDSVKMFILCSPHNPTGRVWTRDEILEIVDFCYSHNIILFSDEIHSDMVYKSNMHTPIVKMPQKYLDNVILANSITKTFNVPGLIISSLIIPNEDIRKKVEDMIDRAGMRNPNIYALAAMEAAYNKCEYWVDDVIGYIYGNYLFTKNYFKQYFPQLKIVEPQGTYLLWIDCRALNISESQLEDWFVNHAKVGVYMGSGFGEESEGFIRVNIATSRELLKSAYDRMRDNYHMISSTAL